MQLQQPPSAIFPVIARSDKNPDLTQALSHTLCMCIWELIGARSAASLEGYFEITDWTGSKFPCCVCTIESRELGDGELTGRFAEAGENEPRFRRIYLPAP